MNVKMGRVRGKNNESWVWYQTPKNRVDLWKWKWHQSIVVPMQGWCDPWSIWWHYWLIKISTSKVEVNHNVSKKENTISVSGDSTLYKLWLESTPSLKILDSLWSHKLQHFHQKSVLGEENKIFWWKGSSFLDETYKKEIVQKLCPWKINGIPFPRSLEGRQHFLKERESVDQSGMQATLIDRLLIHNHIHSLTRRSRQWCHLIRCYLKLSSNGK